MNECSSTAFPYSLPSTLQAMNWYVGWRRSSGVHRSRTGPDWPGPNLSKETDRRPDRSWTGPGRAEPGPVLDRKLGRKDRKMALSTCAITHDHAARFCWAWAAHAYGQNRAPSPVVAVVQDRKLARSARVVRHDRATSVTGRSRMHRIFRDFSRFV